ncbi:MAG: hypothetical protein RE469_09455 [Cuniculiplasma divulgatum]|nr:MAG: hypothetical protein RE469_09455 [Cuniculiplasma divulgatum]
MMLFKYYLKSLLSNRPLWAWGTGFTVFWLFMGAFVFGFNMTTKQESLGYTSVWYSIIGLIASGVIATTISYSVYYANASLAYSFRFTKLRPSTYVFSLMAGTAVVATIIGAILMAVSALMYSYKSHYSLIPVMPLQSLGVFFLSGIFMFLLAVILVVSVNNYTGLKSISFVAFIPQILSYIFAFSALGQPLPVDLVYASPFSDIQRLLMTTYYGHRTPLNLNGGIGPLLNTNVFIVSLLFWIALLFAVSIILVSRIRPASIEEGRQV